MPGIEEDTTEMTKQELTGAVNSTEDIEVLRKVALVLINEFPDEVIFRIILTHDEEEL